MNPQTLNKYSYVVNNPAILVDPSGNIPSYSSQPRICLDGEGPCVDRSSGTIGTGEDQPPPPPSLIIWYPEVDDEGNPVDEDGDGHQDWNWEVDWSLVDDDPAALVALIALSEEGVKFGTENQEDLRGVIWAITFRYYLTVSYSDPNTGETITIDYATWHEAAVSNIHGARTPIAQNLPNRWGWNSTFGSEEEMLSAWNYAYTEAENAIAALSSGNLADSPFEGGFVPFYWRDGKCSEGICLDADNNDIIDNLVPYNRTHFGTLWYGNSSCVSSAVVCD